MGPNFSEVTFKKADHKMTMKNDPTFEFENSLWQQGYSALAGIDEVGRGCLAGPVVAGAVILPARFEIETLHGVRDSKQMTEAQRERMNAVIQKVAVSVGIGEASAEEIDEKGISAATKLAMMRAVASLSPTPDYFLVDAVKLTGTPCTAIIHGDALVMSIAAASVAAKCYRDHLMRELAKLYPGYGFEKHVGYGVPKHIEALNALGITPIHRKSFRPVSDFALAPQ